ncbi:hypothetical protein OCU04_000406 [Sclerotinia nivalis]|uniref:DUF3533 domain-containing protein n=1 Tax=Sclerotinia nivalis TaxID=352851 RepID=A0A9X0AZD7_9HELO|nr:hypothetical protein OCU04_000406 [Sclerotinia nivalis]
MPFQIPPLSRLDSKSPFYLSRSRMPPFSTFYISEDSLALGNETDDTVDRRKVREEEPAIPSEWSLGILPSGRRYPGSTIRSSTKGRDPQSDEESLTGSRRSQYRNIIKYPLPGPLSPHLAENRKLWIKMFVVFCLLLVTTIMGTMSIYWGGDHSLQSNIPVLTIAVIDFDHSEVGRYLQDMTTAARAKDYHHSLGFVNQDGDIMYGNMESVQAALHDQKFWVGIVVMENATKAMNYAYEVGDEPYDPNHAISVFYEEARNALVIGQAVYPKLLDFLNKFVLEFTKQKQSSLLQGINGSDVTALQRQAQNPVAAGFRVFNMAPATPSTAEAATEIGTICMYLSTTCNNSQHRTERNILLTPDSRSYNRLVPFRSHVRQTQRHNNGNNTHENLLHLPYSRPPICLFLFIPLLSDPLMHVAHTILSSLRCSRLSPLLDAFLDLHDGLRPHDRKHKQHPRHALHACFLRLLGHLKCHHGLLSHGNAQRFLQVGYCLAAET